MADFGEQYQRVFASLGRPLRRQDRVPNKELITAEKQLGLCVPAALREYYQVAGRADDFNCSHDRLLRPADWTIESRKLTFMVENQAVLFYGIPINPQQLVDDPAVFMGYNNDPIRWYKVNGQCSDFLLVMLHVQAAFGGAMPYRGTAQVHTNLRKLLDREWSFVGVSNQMRVYHNPMQAVCLEKKDDCCGRIYVGASSDAELAAVARELNLQWDYPAFYTKGVKISFSVQGEGEAVLLIHGLFSSSGLDWWVPGTTTRLAEKYKVISLDLPGHGLSDKPTKEKAYGPELVENIIRLMDHLKIKKAHIVGNCLGAIVAAKLISKHWDRVLSGTLAGMGWLRNGDFAEKVFEHFRQIANVPIRACARSLGELSLTMKEIESIRVPIIILVGERDEVVKELYIEPLRAVRKDWRVVNIRRANHLNCHAKPQFREEIVKWLTKHTKR